MKQTQVLLNAVAVTTNGTAMTTENANRFTFWIEPAGTVSMVHKIQGLAPSGTWVDIDSRTLTTTTAVLLQCAGPFKQVRAAVTITTGTVTTTMDCL